jgi:ABC-type sugar transport system substrate-binding protein
MSPRQTFSTLRSALLVLTFLLILSACGAPTTNTGSSSSPQSGKNPSDIHVGFVTETSSLNFAAEMAAGAQYAANQYHVSAQIVAPPNIDDEAAVKLFQDLTRTATDGIGVMTLAPDLFVRPETQAIQAGIPVIAIDVEAPASTGITTFVGNDNVQAGALLADEAIKHLPQNASGAIVVGIDTPGVPPLLNRYQGIKQEFNHFLPKVQVLGPFDSKQEPQANYEAWSGLIKAHANALAYLGVGDTDNASLARIKQAQNGKYLTAAFDLNDVGLQAVASGTNYALVDPEHFLKGYVAMRLLIEHALHGTAIPKGWWNPGVQLVVQSNVQTIINRQKSLDTKGAYYQPFIAKEFADPAAQIKPYDQAH